MLLSGCVIILIYSKGYIMEIDKIDIPWIREKMIKLLLSQQDVAEDFQSNKGWISDILNPKGRSKKLTKFQKIAFYYYFRDKQNR